MERAGPAGPTKRQAACLRGISPHPHRLANLVLRAELSQILAVDLERASKKGLVGATDAIL